MGPQDVLALLKSAGWVGKRLPARETVKDRIDEYRNPFPDGIKGCIDRDGVLWRFQATLNIEDRSVEEVDVRSRPVCPECRAELSKETVDLPGSETLGGIGSPYTNRFDAKRRRALCNRPIWECVSCDFSDSREASVRSDVETVSLRHVERIIESRDEPYSLPALVESVEEVDARSVWEAYDDVVDDTEVSTQCFH